MTVLKQFNTTTAAWTPILAGDANTVFNVKDYGAVGYPTDDTAAITAAWAAALAAGAPLIFPAGAWVYNGAGLDPGGLSFPFIIRGAGRSTSIVLGATSYLIDSAAPLPELQLSDMTIFGGYGAVRSTSTSTATTATLRSVERVFFHEYTKAAISHSSSDCPDWQIKGCTFWADETSTTSMGVAMAGLTDSVSIVECEFRHDRVHVKLGDGGNNAHINRCAFLRYDTARPGSHPIVDVWVVPTSGPGVYGEGLTLTDNKFGNENLTAGDWRVVYAGEGAGTNFGDRFPDLATNLTTDTPRISGHVYTGNVLHGTTGINPPFVRSMTAAINGVHIGPMIVGGTLPDHIVSLSHQPANLSRSLAVNSFGPLVTLYGSSLSTPQVCNYPGLFGVPHDPNYVLATHATEPANGPGEASRYVSLVNSSISSWAAYSGTSTTDVLGRSTAGVANVTTAWSGGTTITGHTASAPMWIEFDMRQGGGTPLTKVMWQITGTGSCVHWQRIVDVPATWCHYRFPFTINESADVTLWVPLALTGSGTVEVGRVRVYQSREPLNVDGHIIDLAHRGTRAGFYATAPIAKPTGVPVTAAGVHAALVSLGLIGA
jgi:hypothetical protein